MCMSYNELFRSLSAHRCVRARFIFLQPLTTESAALGGDVHTDQVLIRTQQKKPMRVQWNILIIENVR